LASTASACSPPVERAAHDESARAAANAVGTAQAIRGRVPRPIAHSATAAEIGRRIMRTIGKCTIAGCRGFGSISDSD
jgi:hypothetical protein